MPHSRTLPTPSNPTAEGTTYYGAATITAPASLIWSTLLDLPNYTWNPFTPLITRDPPSSDSDSSELSVGAKLVVHAYIPPHPSSTLPHTPASLEKHKQKAHKTPVQVSVIDPQRYMLAWKATGYPSFFLKTERVMEIEDFGDGKCEFRNFETFRGTGRHAVGLAVGAVSWDSFYDVDVPLFMPRSGA